MKWSEWSDCVLWGELLIVLILIIGLNNPISQTLIGAYLAICTSRYYYKKASDDLRNQVDILRKIGNALGSWLESKGEAKFSRDENENITYVVYYPKVQNMGHKQTLDHIKLDVKKSKLGDQKICLRGPAMARRKSISSTRGLLYKMARLLGDVEAIERGPGAMGRRMERRLVGQGAGRLMGLLFRGPRR
jgi:hypothetical protein